MRAVRAARAVWEIWEIPQEERRRGRTGRKAALCSASKVQYMSGSDVWIRAIRWGRDEERAACDAGCLSDAVNAAPPGKHGQRW